MSSEEFALAGEIGRQSALARAFVEMPQKMLRAAGLDSQTLKAMTTPSSFAIIQELTSAAQPFREHLAEMRAVQEAAAAHLSVFREMQEAAASRLSVFREMHEAATSRLSAFREMQEVAASRLSVFREMHEAATSRLSAFREVQEAAASHLSAFRQLQSLVSERITADDVAALRERAFYGFPEKSDGEVPKIDAETVESVSEGLLKELRIEDRSVADAIKQFLRENVVGKDKVLFIIFTLLLNVLGNRLDAMVVWCAQAFAAIKAEIGESKDCSPKKAQKIIKKYKVSIEEIEEYRFVRRPNARVRASRRRGSPVIHRPPSGEAVVVIEKRGRWSEIEYSDGEVEIQGWMQSKYLVRPRSDSPRRPLFTRGGHSD